MTITTEEAERLAVICALWGMDNSATTIRSLAAERDALQARVAELEARLRALLECPVIAVARHHDPDSYCDETVFAETQARAALEGKKDE